MSNLWINIRFWRWHLQAEPWRLSFFRNAHWDTESMPCWIEVYQFFGYHKGYRK